MAKAVALLSGGLDSQLAVKLVQLQGVQIHALHFRSIFNAAPKDPADSPPARAAAALGVPLTFIDITTDQIALLKAPPHGFGSAANPCIDCHILMLRYAAGRMIETGADFLVTGEVLGQRPMSQRRHALAIIDKETGLAGRILRPLSAKALDPTIPEETGLVDREKLEDIKGRSRQRQIALAETFGLTNYPSPAGGCLLTDPGFGLRVKDLLAHDQMNLDNAVLLKFGRHFRLSPSAKAVVARNEDECQALESLARPGDLLIDLADLPGPTALLRGDVSDDVLATAAALTARSSKARSLDSARLRVRTSSSDDEAQIVNAPPASDDLARKLSINPF